MCPGNYWGGSMELKMSSLWFVRFGILFGIVSLSLGVATNSGCNNSTSTNQAKAETSSAANGQNTIKKKTGRIKLDLEGLPKANERKDFAPGVRFKEIQKDVGIEFVYQNGMKGYSLMVETTGGGVSWLDYDLDGNQDLFFCQGGDPTKGPLPEQPIDMLCRQLDPSRFQVVTGDVGVKEHGYSQGISAGDFDGDGFEDLYVTNCGKNTLWQNMGDGTFVEVTDVAGTGGGERWSSTSAWADIDLDGDLDLYVCNYVQYDRFNPHPCVDDEGRPAICHPKHVDAWPDALFINNGDGTFTDESQSRGVFGKGNKGLGVAIADFNRDGYPDIYVANDTTANFMFINDGHAKFKEVAGLQGCDVDRSGSFQASMGLGIYDYDENGLLDIFLTHYEDESHTLYKNGGEIGFQDVTAIVKLYSATLPWLGFGTIMADFNNDTRADIFVAQGHVNNTPRYKDKQKMPAALYSYDGSVFHELTESGGEYFGKKFIGRGVAASDFDRDGDWDLAVGHQNEQASLLSNESDKGHFLKFRFIGTDSNRMGYGTQVTVYAGERKFFQELVAGTSYVSSNEPILIFGLGDFDGKCDVEIRWPNGKTQKLSQVDLDQSLVLVESE